LHEDGEDIANSKLPDSITDDPTFILSDHKDFTEDELEQITERSTITISLGPMILHTDQCLTIIHNYLDRLNSTKKK
jgi:tRNA (pseudouridine54-N1)-methyltransferase